MSTEQRLRDAMTAIASPVEPGPDEWSRLQSAVATQRRRRVREALLATVAAAALVAGLVVVVDREPDGSSVRVVPPATAPTTPTTRARVPGLPEHLIAVADDGRVVLLVTATGRVSRVISAPTAADARPQHVSISDDGRTAFYTGGSIENGLPLMFQVDLPDGSPRPIGRGHSPRLSPDGRRLAFLSGAENDFGVASRLVVRELRSGEERHWDLSPERVRGPLGLSPALVWSTDSKRLAYELSWEGTNEVGILDLSIHRTFDEAQKVPRSGSGMRSYSSPLFLDDRGLAIFAADYTEPDEPLKRHGVILLDPSTGRQLESIFEPYWGYPSFDPTGRHMLYTTQREPPVRNPDSYVLMRRSDGVSTKIAEGYVDADW
jgi:hypothetical protein